MRKHGSLIGIVGACLLAASGASASTFSSVAGQYTAEFQATPPHLFQIQGHTPKGAEKRKRLRKATAVRKVASNGSSAYLMVRFIRTAVKMFEKRYEPNPEDGNYFSKIACQAVAMG